MPSSSSSDPARAGTAARIDAAQPFVEVGVARRGVGAAAAVRAGPHEVGKKLVEEAAEVWMAAEHEGRERTAEEISQLLYHIQVMMLACDLSLEDVYAHL